MDSTANAIDPTTNTLLVQLKVDNASGALLPGAYADVHFKVPPGALGLSLQLPANTLLFRSDGIHVATVDGTGHVVLKPIIIGRDYGAAIEVVKGLTPGDVVILSPPDSLLDHAPVRVGCHARGGCLNVRHLVTSGVLAALLGACSLAPRYVPPKLEQQVPQYKEAGEWAPAAPADEQPRPDWWQAFGDPKLNELQQQLHAGNPDLRAAFARFEQARALAGAARSQQYPQLNLDASAVRGRDLAQRSEHARRRQDRQ